jgi:hypothetical protein
MSRARRALRVRAVPGDGRVFGVGRRAPRVRHLGRRARARATAPRLSAGGTAPPRSAWTSRVSGLYTRAPDRVSKSPRARVQSPHALRSDRARCASVTDSSRFENSRSALSSSSNEFTSA